MKPSWASRSFGEPRHKSAVLQETRSKSPWLKTAATRLRRVVFFQVDNAEAAFAALTANGLGRDHANFEVTAYGDDAFKQFFVVAPDGLCNCLGEKVK
jgi:hypothetical protein